MTDIEKQLEKYTAKERQSTTENNSQAATRNDKHHSGRIGL